MTKHLSQFFFILVAILPMCARATQAGGGGSEAHGGDADAYEFVALARNLERSLKRQPQAALQKEFGLRAQDFTTAIETTRVFTVDQFSDTGSLPQGQSICAVNFSDRKVIELKRSCWKKLDGRLELKLPIVLHEFLGILKLEQDQYHLTSRLYDYIEFDLNSQENSYRPLRGIPLNQAEEVIDSFLRYDGLAYLDVIRQNDLLSVFPAPTPSYLVFPKSETRTLLATAFPDRVGSTLARPFLDKKTLQMEIIRQSNGKFSIFRVKP